MKKEIETTIVEAYERGNSLRTIGRRIGHSHCSVWKIIRKLKPEIMRPPRQWNKYSFNHRYFENWNSENSYWMGFIAADGHIDTTRRRIELKLHSRDTDRLIAFRSTVSGNFPIYHYRTRPHVGILMFSREIVNDLIQKGIGPKSLTLGLPAGIPRECTRHFIRGYFDGDGSISLSWTPNGRLRPIFQILGSKCLLEWIKGKLIEQAGVKSRINIGFQGRYYRLSMGSRRSLIKIRRYLYDNVNESLCMKRKKEKFYVKEMELTTDHLSPKWL